MALKATIYKAELSITDMDRNYYETHSVTVAKHPSETDERMMVRLLAFALNADERLEFTKGLSTDEEPEIWQKDFSGEIELWVELGLPSEKRIRQACHKSQTTKIYSYGGRNADLWWEKTKNATTRFNNLHVINITDTDTKALESLVKRTMALQITIQDGEVMIAQDDQIIQLTPQVWREA